MDFPCSEFRTNITLREIARLNKNFISQINHCLNNINPRDKASIEEKIQLEIKKQNDERDSRQKEEDRIKKIIQ